MIALLALAACPWGSTADAAPGDALAQETPQPSPGAVPPEGAPIPPPVRRPGVPERFAIEEALGLRGEQPPPPPLELHPEAPRLWGGVASIPAIREDYLKEIEDLWIRRRQLVPQNATQGDKLLDRIYEIKLENGHRNLFPVSAALVREARRGWTSGDRERARDLLSVAGRLSPDLPSPYFQTADLLWREGPGSFAPALERVLEGVAASHGSFREKVRVATSAGLLLMITLLTLLMVLPMTLLVRHRRSIFHVLDHLRPGSLGRTLSLFMLAVAFLSLAYLRIGPGWLILALLAFVWLPSTRWEKVAAGVLWAFFALAPVLLGGLVNLLGALQRCAQDPLVRAQVEGYHPELRAAFVRALDRSPEDVDLLQGLALVARRGGHYDFAERVLLAALDRRPESASLHNNLANVLYWEGREAEAEALLRRAIEIDPGFAHAHFNLSQILRKGFKLAEGEDEYLEARKLDSRLIQDHTFTSSQTPNRFLIDAMTPDVVLRSRLFPSAAERNANVALLWSWIMKGLPWGIAGPVLGGIWAVFLALTFSPSRHPLFPPVCTRCGTPICARCGPVPKEENECESCLAMAVGNPPLDPLFKRNKIRMLRRSRRVRKILAWTLSILIPGSGQVLEGSPVLGGLAMVTFFLLVFKLVFWNGIVNPQVVVFAGPTGPLVVAPVMAILLLYVAVNIHLSHLRSRSDE